MSADVVAACRQEIERQRGFATRDKASLPTTPGRLMAARYIEALDAFTAILDQHQNFAPSLNDRCRVCHDEVPCGHVRIIARALGVPVDGQQ